ncbi:MAG: hypothetical protein K0S54_2258 [Alphaproteobacteria bacterium]|jgi:tripartite ATP-independent transporter DctM subunit|nr:hypothetical protein [Alphaproteobacteria bacterium]
MDPLLFGFLAIAAMLALTILSVPVAASLGLVGIGGMFLYGGWPLVDSSIRTLPYQIVSEYAFVVIPMFILMGTLASNSGITGKLYQAAYAWFSSVRGSLYMATIAGSAGFAAISGSTMVNAAVFTRIALPEMIRFGYDRAIGAGCIAAAGTFAALIPPSIAIVLVAILADVSIGALLMAGVIPGLLTAGIYLIGVAVMMRLRPDWAPQKTKPLPFRERMESLKGVWGTLVLAAIIIGGIYSGTMFPSSAGAIGAIGALLIALVARSISRDGFRDAIAQTAASATILFVVIIGGMLFSRMLVFSGFIHQAIDMFSGIGLTPITFMAGIIVMYLILGMFVDTVSMLVITVPFITPIAKALGIDLIWMSIIIVKLVEIATISPPVGLNLYAVLSAAEGKIKAEELFRGVMPFLLLEGIILVLLWVFPEICTWLPSQM